MSDKIYQNEHGLPFIEDPTLGPISLGCLKPDPNFCAFPDFEEKFTVLPQSQWQENSLKDLGLPQRNQMNAGSCTGQGTVTCFTAAKMKSAPTDKFPMLSATFLYGLINGGKDQGAQCSQAMVAVRDTGTCLDSQVPTNMIFKTQFPKEAFTTAKRFKALEAYKLTSWEALVSALSLGIPCASGIAVGRNFVNGKLRDNGLALLPDTIVGGHCLAHLGLKNIDGVWAIETMNSWGANWGLHGWCYLQKEHWNPGYGFPFDAFAIYSVIEDPDDKESGPPMIAFGESDEPVNNRRKRNARSRPSETE